MKAIMISTFSERLRAILDETGIRQTDLCEKSGIGKSAMSQYLHGAFIPKQAKLSAIAEALGVSEGWLMGYDVPRKRVEAVQDSGMIEVAAVDGAMAGAHIPYGAVVRVRRCESIAGLDNGSIVCFSMGSIDRKIRYYNRLEDMIVLTAAESDYAPVVISADAIESGDVVIHGVAEKVEMDL